MKLKNRDLELAIKKADCLYARSLLTDIAVAMEKAYSQGDDLSETACEFLLDVAMIIDSIKQED